jgi:alkylation response protein AidB-like acyl-CoA dehydrogenase
MDANPLISDRFVDFLLHDVLDAGSLCRLPYFADHSRETFDLVLHSARRLARDLLFPTYKPMDEEPARYIEGRIVTHPLLKRVYPRLIELGLAAATRPEAVGGQQLPHVVSMLASAYLMAGNLSAYGYIGLTSGAAHLIEAFGDESLRETYVRRLYTGEWTGTMALTEPQAGSSLADVTSKAIPDAGGFHRIQGAKIFISGGDHDLTENVVHLVLARIEGAPAGTRGISLFVVPARRFEGDALVDNDVSVAGAIHKIGWRGLASVALSFGERGDCRGWLVGAPHQGLRYMFQMMNEARLMVGVNAAATASVAYHEALRYARTRVQGRPPGVRDGAPVPIIEHADVRRMLLRQRAIVEGSLALLATTARHADLAAHAESAAERERAQLLLDLLTPVAKTFPAEKGFEANALAVQVHGGYGYSSEYLPEAWLRDQKLNTLHEGTTGIQSLDLLGRKAVVQGGRPLLLLGEDIGRAIEEAEEAGLPAVWGQRLGSALQGLGGLTATLGRRGAAGDVTGMLAHSADYLELFSVLVVAWQWLRLATVATRAPVAADFREGIRCTAQYWMHTELPRAEHLIRLCQEGEDSYVRMQPGWFQ